MGFENMTPEERRAAGSKGGLANQKRHKWTPEEARTMGRKGGIAVAEKYGPEHMSELGRKGASKRDERA
jgi:general stress protein YciG